MDRRQVLKLAVGGAALAALPMIPVKPTSPFASALDRVCIRRKMLAVRRALEDVSHRVMFDPLDEAAETAWLMLDHLFPSRAGWETTAMHNTTHDYLYMDVRWEGPTEKFIISAVIEQQSKVFTGAWKETCPMEFVRIA